MSKAMFQIQIIGGIVLAFCSFYYIIISFLVIIKINIYEDCIITHKLLTKKKIMFANIKNVSYDKRHFIGEGRFSERQAVVVSYTEDSGYGDEVFFNHNENLHNHLNKIL
jgi:hypothetical protein